MSAPVKSAVRNLFHTAIRIGSIAAMSATGTSVISNIEQIDRGYENIESRLNALGAKIERMK